MGRPRYSWWDMDHPTFIHLLSNFARTSCIQVGRTFLMYPSWPHAPHVPKLGPHASHVPKLASCTQVSRSFLMYSCRRTHRPWFSWAHEPPLPIYSLVLTQRRSQTRFSKFFPMSKNFLLPRGAWPNGPP